MRQTIEDLTMVLAGVVFWLVITAATLLVTGAVARYLL